jgi:hypothetical protein
MQVNEFSMIFYHVKDVKGVKEKNKQFVNDRSYDFAR